MAVAPKSKNWFNASLLGPVIQSLVIVGGMLWGHAILSEQVRGLDTRVETLYKLLIYPRFEGAVSTPRL